MKSIIALFLLISHISLASTQAQLPISILTAGNMSGNLTSNITEIQFKDNPDIHCSWGATGSPVGTLDVQISLDQVHWESVPFTGVSNPSGTAGSAYFSLNQTSAAYIKLVYTRTSGSGTLGCMIAVKSV